MKINREEIIWAAGFFDGEGHAGYSIGPRYFDIRLRIDQNDRKVLDRFQQAVGGIGHINGPYIRKKPGHQPYFVWAVNSFEKVQAIITMLHQFLSPIKKEQCMQTLKRYHEWDSVFVPQKPGPKVRNI